MTKAHGSDDFRNNLCWPRSYYKIKKLIPFLVAQETLYHYKKMCIITELSQCLVFLVYLENDIVIFVIKCYYLVRIYFTKVKYILFPHSIHWKKNLKFQTSLASC